MPITVSIVEDARETREALVAVLRDQENIRCLGVYATAEEAVRGMTSAPPDVALIDINLPGMSGIECVARLRTVVPRVQVLMLTTYEETDMIFESLRAGASGYLLKRQVFDEVLQSVEQVHAGGAPMSMEIARKVVEHFRGPPAAPSEPDAEPLTERERELLDLLAQGFLYKEIADRLNVSYNTVRTHLNNIYRKLHVQSRAHAALKYLSGHVSR